jgi:hypothetical protein
LAQVNVAKLGFGAAQILCVLRAGAGGLTLMRFLAARWVL